MRDSHRRPLFFMARSFFGQTPRSKVIVHEAFPRIANRSLQAMRENEPDTQCDVSSVMLPS